jgi:mono/diheme cytochrome c family protein
MRPKHGSKTSRLRGPRLLLVALTVLLVPAFQGANLALHASGPSPATLQDAQGPNPASCKGVLAQSATLKTTLQSVPKYQRTYVLVLAGAAKDKIASATSPGLTDLSVELNDEPQAVAVAGDLHITNVHRVNAGESPAQPLVDLGAGKTEAVIMWGPLAAAAAIDLGLDDKVSIFSVDRPQDPPAAFAGSAAGQPNACGAAIADELDSFGVLPAELLVRVNIRDLLNTPTPKFSMQNAEQGEKVFQQVCARCHGQQAVADPTLAPVDLLVSIRRFQFIGFKYIVMNGRPQRGMPPLRGTVSEDQIALIFQYLQARSKHMLTASGTEAAKR